jgi:hypothetical protein
VRGMILRWRQVPDTGDELTPERLSVWLRLECVDVAAIVKPCHRRIRAVTSDKLHCGVRRVRATDLVVKLSICGREGHSALLLGGDAAASDRGREESEREDGEVHFGRSVRKDRRGLSAEAIQIQLRCR